MSFKSGFGVAGAARMKTAVAAEKRRQRQSVSGYQKKRQLAYDIT
jgi:hypothetical protein